MLEDSSLEGMIRIDSGSSPDCLISKSLAASLSIASRFSLSDIAFNSLCQPNPSSVHISKRQPGDDVSISRQRPCCSSILPLCTRTHLAAVGELPPVCHNSGCGSNISRITWGGLQGYLQICHCIGMMPLCQNVFHPIHCSCILICLHSISAQQA